MARPPGMVSGRQPHCRVQQAKGFRPSPLLDYQIRQCDLDVFHRGSAGLPRDEDSCGDVFTGGTFLEQHRGLVNLVDKTEIPYVALAAAEAAAASDASASAVVLDIPIEGINFHLVLSAKAC